MLSRLQPAFILIPPVERTSQGGSSSPLSCPPLTDPPPVDFAFRLDSPFFTHTRSHATHAHTGVRGAASRSPFLSPPLCTPRILVPILRVLSSALPPPAPFHPLLPSLSLYFFPSIRRYEYVALPAPLPLPAHASKPGSSAVWRVFCECIPRSSSRNSSRCPGTVRTSEKISDLNSPPPLPFLESIDRFLSFFFFFFFSLLFFLFCFLPFSRVLVFLPFFLVFFRYYFLLLFFLPSFLSNEGRRNLEGADYVIRRLFIFLFFCFWWTKRIAFLFLIFIGRVIGRERERERDRKKERKIWCSISSKRSLNEICHSLEYIWRSVKSIIVSFFFFLSFSSSCSLS